jgi:serine/threonine protein kinase
MKRLKIYEGDSLYTKYLIGDVIGTGNFSIVYKCQEKKTGKAYALKMI